MVERGHDRQRHTKELRCVVPVGTNVLLAVAQLAGGIFSGSLALVADALHNLHDAASPEPAGRPLDDEATADLILRRLAAAGAGGPVPRLLAGT